MSLFLRIYQPPAAEWDRNTAAERWFLPISVNYRGHGRGLEAFCADSTQGGKGADWKRAQKKGKYQCLQNSWKKIAAGKTKTDWWEWSRDVQPRKTGGRTVQVWPDLSCLSCHWWGPWGPHCGPQLLIMTSIWPWGSREVLTGPPAIVSSNVSIGLNGHCVTYK